MRIKVLKPTVEDEHKKKRVCAYARVSTDAEEQENSLENQKSYYEEMIKSNPNYEFAGVFADFGISGFKERRPAFQKMIQKAREGKIDLIITKSVSRFARNTVIVLKAARELKELNVGIFFELQNINTLTESGELMMTVISAFAQAESEEASKGAKMVYRRKYQNGEVVAYLERSFGYQKDEYGDFIQREPEASIVREMYEMAAEGVNLANIKRYLNDKGIRTVKGAKWHESAVLRILENEIYKGDFILQKHYVNAERKLVRNKGELDRWYIEDNHVAIVSRKLWGEVQERLEKKREYLATGSVVGELNEETYPYMNQIYCAECGHPLYRRIYSNGNRINWGCSGTKRYHKGFCDGINIPDSLIREWGEIKGNIYISSATDKFGVQFKYVTERTWKKTHKKKEFYISQIVPELKEENYPYYKKIYCAKCGSRLVRLVKLTQTLWICDGNKRKGKVFCSGTRVPDMVIRSWGNIAEDLFILRKEDEHGKKHYSYTSKPRY